MNPSFLQSLAGLSFTLKRLWSRRGLAASLAGGLYMAVALAVAVPLYADGVNYRLLAANLASSAAANQRPSFSFLFH